MRERALADGLSEQIGDAILGDDVVDVGARDANAVARLEQGLDPRGAALVVEARQTIGLPPGGTGRTTNKRRLVERPP